MKKANGRRFSEIRAPMLCSADRLPTSVTFSEQEPNYREEPVEQKIDMLFVGNWSFTHLRVSWQKPHLTLLSSRVPSMHSCGISSLQLLAQSTIHDRKWHLSSARVANRDQENGTLTFCVR